jgi:Transketolase, thiamine diphosphate binding domain
MSIFQTGILSSSKPRFVKMVPATKRYKDTIKWIQTQIVFEVARSHRSIFSSHTRTTLFYSSDFHIYPIMTTKAELELLCVNTIRAVSADQPQAANSGHPGAPMGCAPMAYLLWNEFMNYSSSDPAWINRDRFVLSNGHACALQYTMLHLTGYGLTTDDLSQFRRLGSKTPGHPESFVTPGMRVFLLIDVVFYYYRCCRSTLRSNQCRILHGYRC